MALSFNAGKDSCALMHLIRAALNDHQESISEEQKETNARSLGGIRCFMFIKDDEFTEMQEFSKEMDQKYGLEITYLECPMPIHLKRFVEEYGIKAVLLGTRRGDPNSPGQSLYTPTTEDWPPLMRINPILEWSYQNIWDFLRRCHLPYCRLYDAGYTSIGSISDTRPNSSLKKENGSYAPAYLLSDGRLERLGRRKSHSNGGLDISTLTKKAALLIIGDELLSGKVEDMNVVYLSRELRSLGWRVNRVVFVGDDATTISEEVHSLSASHAAVFTAGGVGPTVDDVTMEGIALAMQTSLARNPFLENLMRSHFKDNVTEAHLKMTEVPKDEVEFIDTFDNDGRLTPFPLVKCRNVYVLPGVPDYLKSCWKAAKRHLEEQESLPPFHNVVFRLKIKDETEIAPALDVVSQEMGPEIEVGSYPVNGQEDGVNVLVSLECKIARDLQTAKDILFKHLSPKSILSEVRQVKKWNHSRASMQDILSLQPNETSE